MMEMIIGSCEVTFRADWVTSLKEKRMVLKSLMEKTRHKFNISIAEVDNQDNHKLLTIGFACVSKRKPPRGQHGATCAGFYGKKYRGGANFCGKGNHLTLFSRKQRDFL
ncbi:MAG: DUF503 domain-containing protein [Anaerotignum sp.]